MLHLIKNIAVTILIVSVVLLTFIAVLSIWDVVSDDLFFKSMSTMGILAFASSVILIAIKYLEGKKDQIV